VPKRFYRITRDLHLYSGLFISPFVLVFAASIFFLVHAWIPGRAGEPATPQRVIDNLAIPANIESLGGRARVEALSMLLRQAGVEGEIGFVRHIPAKHQMEVPLSIPGREITADIDLGARRASIFERETGLADAVVTLHKLPGPHLVEIRMNWTPIRVWRWFADGTVYLLLFISASGVYLWTVVRAARRTGMVLAALGTVSLWGMIYALTR
jgi:hypothetical protein